MDPQCRSNRSLRSRKSSIGRFAEETVDGVLHVLLRLPGHPARVVLLLLPVDGDVLSMDDRGGDVVYGIDAVACWRCSQYQGCDVDDVPTCW